MKDQFSTDELFYNEVPDHLAQSNCGSPNVALVSIHPSDISEELLCQSIRSLNCGQRNVYDSVLTWCRNKMKNLNSIKPKQVEPLYLFITGGAGTGKSHLIRSIYHTAVKTFKSAPFNPDIPAVLLMAPTGVAAVNINGTTINSALAIPSQTGNELTPMQITQERNFDYYLQN